MMAVWKRGPAIAAGNTVVFKPSDTTPSSSLKLTELIQGIIPAGVINIMLGDASTGATLVAHPTVRAAGKPAGEKLKRSHLELGHEAPVLVCVDADLDAAVDFFYLMLSQVFSRPDIAALSKNTLINVLICPVFIVIVSTNSYQGLDTTKAVQCILVGFQFCVLVLFAGMALYQVYNGKAFDCTEFSWE